MPSKRLLICDLDNTLYDWVGYFVPSFYAMVDVVVEITGCDKEKLLDDFRTVHQMHGDSEHPFALLETNTIKSLYRHATAAQIMMALDPAFHAFNSARKQNLHLHPEVRDTLDQLMKSGVKLIAHTESKLYGVVDRLNRLDLFRFFDKVYCRERSLSPYPKSEQSSEWFARIPMQKITELSHHQSKPNQAVLLEICRNEGVAGADAAYVGDSMARDVLMAKRANVFAIWAAYGAQHDDDLYRRLVRISHWTSEEVAQELTLKDEVKNISPNYVARRSFSDVLAALGIALPPQRVAAF